jgi:hypothetical protein
VADRLGASSVDANGGAGGLGVMAKGIAVGGVVGVIDAGGPVVDVGSAEAEGIAVGGVDGAAVLAVVTAGGTTGSVVGVADADGPVVVVGSAEIEGIAVLVVGGAGVINGMLSSLSRDTSSIGKSCDGGAGAADVAAAGVEAVNPLK